MINVKDDVHISTTIVSIDRMMRKASIYGEINAEDLYLLNTVYDLLNTMCLSLTNKQRQQLISIYNKLAFKSKDICTAVMLKAFQQPSENKSSQQFVDPDCIVKNQNINYWKADSFAEDDAIIDLLSRSFLNNQLKSSRAEFSNGIDLSVKGIGKFCFFINTYTDENITIIDVLNNNVTEAFNIGYIPSLNGVLITSKLMYNSQKLNLKIITNG